MELYVDVLAVALVLSTFLSPLLALVPSVGEEWVPYLPKAEDVNLSVNVDGDTANVYVSIVFPSAGYRVSDWGEPTHVGNAYVVDVKIERWTGPSAQVITTLSHQYRIEKLRPGRYSFTFSVWGKPIKQISFQIEQQTPTTNTTIVAIAAILSSIIAYLAWKILHVHLSR